MANARGWLGEPLKRLNSLMFVFVPEQNSGVGEALNIPRIFLKAFEANKSFINFFPSEQWIIAVGNFFLF